MRNSVRSNATLVLGEPQLTGLCVVQTEMVQRLSGGAQSGRASTAEKALEKLKDEDKIEKPFVVRKRSFA